MTRAKLWECSRCRYYYASNTEPTTCPNCWLEGDQVKIRLLTRQRKERPWQVADGIDRLFAGNLEAAEIIINGPYDGLLREWAEMFLAKVHSGSDSLF